MNVRIMLADDHKVICQGLSALIEKEPGIEVVAEAGNGRIAVELAQQHQPDLIMMDIGMPGLNGIEATRRILLNNPETKVIILSMHSDKQLVNNALAAGARGYLLKECAFEELIWAIQSVMSGQIFLSTSITNMLMEEYVRLVSLSRFSDSLSLLTSREREVLQLIAEGKKTKEIASILNVSFKTIENHRTQIMNKLNIYSVADLTKYAIREGLTSAGTSILSF